MDRTIKTGMLNDKVTIAGPLAHGSIALYLDDGHGCKMSLLDPDAAYEIGKALLYASSESKRKALAAFLDLYPDSGPDAGTGPFTRRTRTVSTKHSPLCPCPDLYAMLDGVPTVIDYKSSNDIYDEHKTQVSCWKSGCTLVES